MLASSAEYVGIKVSYNKKRIELNYRKYIDGKESGKIIQYMYRRQIEQAKGIVE